MAAPSAEDFPALGFVPCPGDSDAMEGIVDVFSDTASKLEEVNAVLTGADEGEWRGLTAIAFREVLDDDLRPKVQEAYQSFSDAHRALADWAARMVQDQETARSLEAEAAAAKEALDAAQAGLDGLPAATEGEPPEDETDEDRAEREQNDERREGLERDVQLASSSLDDFRSRAQALRDDYVEAGKDIADQLRDAIALAPNEPGIFGKMAEGISGAFDRAMDTIASIGDLAIGVLGVLAPVLSLFNNLAGILATALSIASMFMPFLAPVALGVAGVVLVTTYAQKVGETGSFTEALKSPTVWAAAAGVVLGGAGLALARSTTPAMQIANNLDDVAGFIMRPSGAYLEPAISTGVRASNAVAGSSYGVEIFNSFVNPEGNHLNNLMEFQQELLPNEENQRDSSRLLR